MNKIIIQGGENELENSWDIQDNANEKLDSFFKRETPFQNLGDDWDHKDYYEYVVGHMNY